MEGLIWGLAGSSFLATTIQLIKAGDLASAEDNSKSMIGAVASFGLGLFLVYVGLKWV